MKFTLFQKITLPINIDVLAFWRVGKGFASLALFSEIACVGFWPGSRLVRVCAFVRLLVTIGPCGTVCVLDSRACGVCACVLSLWRVSQAHKAALPVACVSKNDQRINRFCLCRACEVFW